MKKKILVVGNSASAYALCKVLAKNHDVFVTSVSNCFSDFAHIVDIRENNPKEILEFVLENDIDLTILTSRNSINTDIVELFNRNKQLIFGSSKNTAETIFNKYFAKKLMYKLHIPTPKFGIFDKENSALEYLKIHEEPYIIKTNNENSAVVANSVTARSLIKTIFNEKNQKLILEEFIRGNSFSYYAITDGYKALPIGSSIIYRHSLEGDGGQITSGMGAISPNYKLSISQEYYIMDNIIYPTLEYLSSNNSPYVGIIGVNGILTPDNKIFILGYHNFIQDCDAANILNLLEEDLPKLFESCIIGSFSDDTEHIKTSDMYSVSLTMRCTAKNNNSNNIIGLDNISDDTIITLYPSTKKNKYMEYEAGYGPVLTLTALSSTVAGAAKKVWNEINDINFDGINYRKDICNHTNFK